MRGYLMSLMVGLALVLAGCGGMKIDDVSRPEPVFRIEDYFQGKSAATGMFVDRFGKVRRQFVVDLDGVWDGQRLTLTEDFRYDDGETERRVWVFARQPDGSYEGRADGVIGTGRAQARGNAFNLRYRFSLKVGEDRWEVDFDDWMFLQPDGVVLNRASVTKLGFEIGTVIVSFRRLNDGRPAAG